MRWSDVSLTRLGLTLGAIGTVSILVDIWLLFLIEGRSSAQIASSLTYVMTVISYGVTGMILVARRPRNLVGWLLLVVGFFGGTTSFADDLARYGLFVSPGSVVGSEWLAWYAGWAFQPVLAVPGLLLVLFPSGRPVSPKWRWLPWAVALVPLVSIVPQMLAPTLHFGRGNTPYPNPIQLPLSEHTMLWIRNRIVALVLFLLPFALVHLLVRYRRTQGVERQQIKWFGLSIVAALLCLGPIEAIPGLTSIAPSVGLALIPVAITLAITRYRLYDIDRLISRTLSYALVIGTLLGAYLVIVLTISAVSPLGRSSPAAVALTTLVLAACFRPLLGRTRDLIDRRFNRSRYDTQRILEAFSQRLTSEIDISALGTDLTAVVSDTMQPSMVSLWLREPTRGPPGSA